MQAADLMRPPNHGHLAPFSDQFGVMIFLFGKQANLEAEILSFYEVLEFIGTPNLFNALFFLESPTRHKL